MITKNIKKRKQGCHTKSQSWFNNKKVWLAIYEYISSSGNKFFAQKLAKAVSDYLGS